MGFRIFQKKKRKFLAGGNGNKPKPETASERISGHLQEDVKQIEKLLHNPLDLVNREFTSAGSGLQCVILYIEGLVEKNFINDYIIKNIQLSMRKADEQSGSTSGDKLVKQLIEEIISVSEVEEVTLIDDVILNVLSGDTLLFIKGTNQAISISTKGWKDRSISEPVSEAVIRGPRDGFIENIRTNIMLVRRRIKNRDLKFENLRLGVRSEKEVVIAYMDGIINTKIVEELKKRVNSFNMDDLQGTGGLEEWIEDNFLSPFPQIMSTERPDKVSASLLQGKVAVFVDGTPFALIAPHTLGVMFHSPEDYYERWTIATLVRFLRYGAAFIAVFLPSLYVALVSYHPGMIPSKLAFSIASTREGVPFPALVEAIIMEATMELLREAGIRLPKPIGQTIGIVGGLVIGEAAVAAGIVSPIMVIVVALTAIASFSLPSYSFAISLRMIRFGLILFAATFGFYGIVIGYIMINIHLANLKSFGVPYTAPFSPFKSVDWKDLILRAPLTMLGLRPQYLKPKDQDRMDKGDNLS
jgi:spore germination protein